MKALEDMKELLEEQVKKINRKGDAITPQELDNAYKAIDIIKDIETITAMKKAEENQSHDNMQSRDSYAQNGNYGQSNHYPYMMRDRWDFSRDGSYANESYARFGRDGDGDGRYSEESYARGRSPRTGRYISRDSYDGGSYGDSYGDSYESSNRRGSYERGYSSADEKEQLKKTLDEMKHKIDQMK